MLKTGRGWRFDHVARVKRATGKQCHFPFGEIEKSAPRGAVKVTIGEPVTFAGETDVDEIARELEKRVKEL